MRVTHILSYGGSQDGLRFGELVLEARGVRCFLFDRLNRTVRLWKGCRWADIGLMSLDEDPANQAEALALLAERSAERGEPTVSA